jgi:RNA polymerase sigma-70 factor, ECF subfamily
MSTAAMAESSLEFETIFNEYAGFIYRTAYGITGRHADAEDVLQLIFIQLLQRFPADFKKNPRAYLYRAAVNSSLNIVRRRRNEVLINGLEYFEKPVSTDTGDLEVEVRRLYEAIAELKPEAAEIVILRYMHNKSDAEIAQMLGRSRGTIALKLFRARARLKKLLLAKFGESDEIDR